MTKKPDVPVKRPLHKRVLDKLRASMGFSIFCTVLILSLIVLSIIGNYYDQGWSAEQWGPVAAWFGGLLTAGAVTLSLYQSREAKKEADRNREDAERRHTEQAQERSEIRQIQSLKPVWDALTALAVPSAKYLASLTLVEHTLTQLEVERTTGNDNTMLKIAQDAVVSARQQARDFYLDMAPFLMEVEMSFTESLIVVDQDDVWKLVEDLYEASGVYHGKLADSFSALMDKQPVDISEVELYKKYVNTKRSDIVAAARKHLAHAKPMRAIHTGEKPTQTDPPKSR
ncbi:hypothetical protein [Rhodococcoides kyotonense]|uniref:DUF4760 domain-containing protein n=1 Tax=Rhodococcoides kyotonense TaxID=398843 RepID=A0A239MVT9_9NOCA|nr:hypothetical protein [Rhodococcus kyotonensis]SNT46620.1 hypothetical protein SAMN05421642_12339 [Rhodococcus kyotonensis]